MHGPKMQTVDLSPLSIVRAYESRGSNENRYKKKKFLGILKNKIITFSSKTFNLSTRTTFTPGKIA